LHLDGAGRNKLMRTALTALLFSLVLASAAGLASPQPQLDAKLSVASDSSQVSVVQPPGGKDLNIDINVNRPSGGRWYANPVWIAIGGLAVLLVLVLLVLALRGGGGGNGTTIIREQQR
jgi:hypothetical protein